MSLIRDTPRERAREFVVLTGHSDIKTVLQALRHQVFDYLMKPLELGELRNTLSRVRKARESSRAEPDIVVAAPPPLPESGPSPPPLMMPGRSPAMPQKRKSVV